MFILLKDLYHTQILDSVLSGVNVTSTPAARESAMLVLLVLENQKLRD
jgi:hypothetical protein